jgi:zinc resistance-associated protein
MRLQITRNIVTIATVLAVVGFGVYAFAHRGEGYGGYGGMHSRMYNGYGMHHGGYGEPGYDLGENEIKEMEKERDAFFQDTENLRRDVYTKELALRSELTKEDPDAQEAANLQKELSSLYSQLDEKRIEHMIKMRKISPNAGREFMGGRHMGYGSYSPGDCWR